MTLNLVPILFVVHLADSAQVLVASPPCAKVCSVINCMYAMQCVYNDIHKTVFENLQSVCLRHTKNGLSSLSIFHFGS